MPKGLGEVKLPGYPCSFKAENVFSPDFLPSGGSGKRDLEFCVSVVGGLPPVTAEAPDPFTFKVPETLANLSLIFFHHTTALSFCKKHDLGLRV